MSECFASVVTELQVGGTSKVREGGVLGVVALQVLTQSTATRKKSAKGRAKGVVLMEGFIIGGGH